MNIQQRQDLHATLTRSSLGDIQRCWQKTPQDYDYQILRAPETGMVMAVARTENSGEPFNLGEVTVTRCALRLSGGETGIGYVTGRNEQHALHIALLDALAQIKGQSEQVFSQVIEPLKQRINDNHKKQQQETAATRVDFLTMVRGED